MKKLIIFLLLTSLINAAEELFELESFSFSMENDNDVHTDFGYTHGARVSLLFYRGDTQKSFLNIPFTSFKTTNNFISFSYSNQMFTPYDLDQTQLIKDDRPYAGYSYIEIGVHQTSKSSLDSLTLQTGVVGESSKMDSLQNLFHKSIAASNASGWDYQLKDEFIMQLNYMHKWRLEYSKIYDLESVLVPHAGANIGNASIKASGGALYRIGFNIPKDFGMNSMNEGSFSSLPTDSKVIINNPSKWSINLNISAGSNLVFRDIFLDGNTFRDSHSVDKNYFNAYVSLGGSARYKNFSVDYQHNYYSKEYKQRGLHRTYKGYGSLIFSYNFE
ncbi:MAG: lipid A deacylase LpxR family protein [Campylobacterota bacterium]